MSVVWITGASRGIGAATVQKMLAQGVTVIGFARTAATVFQGEQGYIPCTIDITNHRQLEKEVERLCHDYGVPQSVILAAGDGVFSPFASLGLHHFQQQMEIHFFSNVVLLKRLLPHFYRQKGGQILWVGSECSSKGGRQATAYSSAKHAIQGFLVSLREEVRSYGITCTLVAPGLTQTSFFDALSFEPEKGCALDPATVADALVWLYSQRSHCCVDLLPLQPRLSKIRQK